MKYHPNHLLSLNGLRLPVRLGHEESERKECQIVRFDIHIRSRSLPLACLTDDLKDTICYGQLSENLKELCESSTFRLIEFLGWKAYTLFKEKLPPTTLLTLTVKKENPPIPFPNEGASFTLSDDFLEPEAPPHRLSKEGLQ